MSAPSANPYAPLPDAFPPIPRRVRLRAFPKEFLFFALIFFAFAGFGALGFMVAVVQPALSAIAEHSGDIAHGEISDKTRHGKRRSRFRITVAFPVDDQVVSASFDVDEASFDRVNPRDPVKMRYLRSCPTWSAFIEEPPLQQPGGALCGAIFVVCWNAFMLTFAGGLVCQALIWRRLPRLGAPTLGAISAKRINWGKGSRWLLTYRFKSADGAEHESTAGVRQRHYDALEVGSAVTVLYDPARPQRSVIYRCGDYEVIGI